MITINPKFSEPSYSIRDNMSEAAKERIRATMARIRATGAPAMPTLTALSEMSNDDLLRASQDAADELAHYEAADGLTYARERDVRDRARCRWRAICQECLRRGLEPKFALM